MKKRGLIERLEHEPVICAEGFLFEAERRGYLASGEFVPELALENPEALKNIHIDFQHAGSDVVEAFTYNGHREKMRVIGKEDLLEPLNRAALRIAKEVADNPGTEKEKNLLAGNISNTNIHPVDFRRNIITENVRLNELVGKEFFVGNIKLKGHDLCRPCKYLQDKLRQNNFVKEFLHTGGLRCEILTSGKINVGDIIKQKND